MPVLIALGVGVAVGIYGASKGEDLAKMAMVAGGIYVAGKYAKAW